MLRRVILVVLIGGLAVLAAPFVVSSLAIDQRGVLIPGHVNAKREDVGVHYSSVKRSAEITVEYWKPDGSGVGFLKVPVTAAEYDAAPVGQPVTLHYLREQDVPDVPFSKFLRRAHLLPTVRLANQHAFAMLSERIPRWVAAALVAVLVLVLWRLARIPGFIWAVAACVLVAVGALEIADFPRPMPIPTVGVRQGVGRVKSLDRIEHFFRDNHSRGLDADQPIEVVGVEFTPEGRAEPVLAVDLIDAGSVPGLKEQAAISVDYESAAPRTAYIRGATRRFVAKNIAGFGIQGVLCLLVLMVFLAAAWLLRKGYRRLTRGT